MSYIVTHSGTRADAIDTGSPIEFDLETALAHACQLLSDGEMNVAIQDGDGHRISGDDLAACCNGDKKLTAELRAISN
jgi:hypothetical protein